MSCLFRYHGDWRTETQTVVSLLGFMHWLETGALLLHTEAEEKLGCMFLVFVVFYLCNHICIYFLSYLSWAFLFFLNVQSNFHFSKIEYAYK